MGFAAWAPLLLALWGYLIWWAWRNDWQAPTLTRASVRRMWRRLPWPLWAALGIVGVILSLTFVTAFAAPPNTPDTATYHLSRVMHWIQNASLTLFPAHQISQDIQPPWAEYALLNLHLLSASDQLDGLLQWGCFVGCVVGVSLIAARLGAGVRGQVFAALFAATIPMAVIQAASVQNDLVLAYWLVCLVYFLLAYRAASDSHARIRAALLAGLSLGLATLTKGVAYVDALPFLLIFGLWAMHAQRWQVWRLFVALTLLFLALNFGYFARNVSAFDSPLGAKETTSAFVNASFTPDVLALNVVRNLAVEFGSPNTKVNALVTKDATRLLKRMGLNTNDSRATMVNTPVFQARGAQGLWLSDGYTTNSIHLLFALMALVVCLAVPALRRRQALLGYLLALVGAFMLFSLYLRWQAGDNRLLVGLFVLAAPLAGVALEALAQRLRPLGRYPSATHMSLLLAPLLISAAPRLLFAQSRPLLGPGSVLTTPRVDQYFAAFSPAERSYVDGVGIIKASGCHAIGFLVSGPQDRAGYPTGAPAWEYQLWPLLGEPGGGSYRIEDVLVTNQTARLATAQPYASFPALRHIRHPPAASDSAHTHRHWARFSARLACAEFLYREHCGVSADCSSGRDDQTPRYQIARQGAAIPRPLSGVRRQFHPGVCVPWCPRGTLKKKDFADSYVFWTTRNCNERDAHPYLYVGISRYPARNHHTPRPTYLAGPRSRNICNLCLTW